MYFRFLTSFIACLSLATGCSGSSSDSLPGPKTPPVDSGSEGQTGGDNTSVSAGKLAVAYFSFTGTTGKVAKSLSTISGGTLYEITPEEAYGPENSTYYDENTRAYKEQYGPASARPAIRKNLSGVSDSDILLLGFPIWYGKAPRVVLSFLDSYDFSGKTVVPFITSGSTGISEAASELKSTFPTILWKDGTRLNGKTEEELRTWLKGLGIIEEKPVDMSKISISAAGKSITATLSQTDAAKAFAEKLKDSPLTIELEEYGGFEKVGPLGFSLPRSDESISGVPGDIFLYAGNQITIFYGNSSWSYTRLGKVDGMTQSELKAFLGTGDITVTISIVR